VIQTRSARILAACNFPVAMLKNVFNSIFLPVRLWFPTTRNGLPRDLTAISFMSVTASCVMGSRFPPTAVSESSQDTYLVLDDFGGRLGRVWRETDEETATSRDVTKDIADELRRRLVEYDEVPASLQD